MQKEPIRGGGRSRRRFLKTAGVSLASTGALSTATAARGLSNAEAHARARRIYEKTNSAEKRERFLRKHDIPISKVERTYTVPKGASANGPSTSYLDEEDLRIYFSMTEYATDAWDVFLQWNWKNQDADDWGEAPKDQVGIAYEENHYYFNSDEEWHSNDYTDIATFSTTGETGGITWEFQDPYGDDGDNYYGEIIARYNQDDVSEERQIEADYTHTWDGVIDSIELGFPQIITVSWDQEGGAYECRDQYDGDPLVISPSNTTA